MKLAENVTFGGGLAERAGILRPDPARVAALLAHADSRCLVLWRGKPLLDLDRRDRLAWLPPDHPLLADAPRIFLAQEGAAGVFAADLSAWEPAEGDAPQAGFFDASEQRHPDLPQHLGFAELRGVMARLTPREAELAAMAKSVLDWHRTHRFCSTCGKESAMALGGWQRRCPACARAHFPRVDPVVIMLITQGNDVLLGRSHGWPEGMYSLLAGFVEPGETVESAVRREVAEETGVPVGAVTYLASQPWPYPSSLMLGCHGVATGRTLVIDPVEIDDAIWLAREEVMQVFAGNREDIKPARRGSIAQFLLWHWLADRLD
jgi:NAD+ diphosphatase